MSKKRKTPTNENKMISPYCIGYCLNCKNKNPDGLFNKKAHKENNQDVVYIYPLCDDCYDMNLQCDCCKEDFSFKKIQANEHNQFKKNANIFKKIIINDITYKIIKNINNGFKSIKFTCKRCNQKINKLNKFNLFGRISKKGQRSKPQMNNIENIWDYYREAIEHIKFSIQMSGFSHEGETKYLNLIRLIISHHNLNGETLVWEIPSRFSRMKWKHSRSQLIDIINEFEVRIIFYSVVVEKNKTKTIVLNSADDVDVYSNILEPAFDKAYESSKNKGEEFAELNLCRSYKKMKLNHEETKTSSISSSNKECSLKKSDFLKSRNFANNDGFCKNCSKHVGEHPESRGLFSLFFK